MTLIERLPSPLDWKDGLIAAGTAIISLELYVRTLVPGLLPGDGGEFQTLSFTQGHAHTTGYEVYLLLAHAFTLVFPAGDIAHRVNLFSAVCGALTVGLVYLAGKVLSRSHWAGLLGAAALAISATFWSQAIIAEVYTAGSVFTSVILLFILLWYETRRAGFLFVAGLAGGLAIGVHNTNSLFAPAIGGLILLCWKDLGRTWKPALAGAALGAVLFVAAFLVIDAHSTPTSIINSSYLPNISRWDEQPQDLSTLPGRFAFLVFARQWRTAMFSGDPSVLQKNIANYARYLSQDFSLPLLLLAPLGLIALYARRWRLGVFFSLALLVHTVYTLNYNIGDIYVFYVSLYVYLCPLIAEGAAVLLRGLARLTGWLPQVLQPALALLLLALAIVPVLPQRVAALQAGELRFNFMNLMSNRELQDWHIHIVENVRHLPTGAIILTDWDKLYPSYYAAEIEQDRNDLTFIETYPYAVKAGIAGTLIVFLKANIAQGRPVYSDHEISELNRVGLTSHLTVIGTQQMFQIEPD